MSQIEQLLARAKSGDQNALEQFVTENSGLIWSVAKRFIGRGVEAEDLYQLGCLGFLKAVDGFDLSYGTQFSTYAVPKISGEIRRFLRDDGAVKVSRSLKERAIVIKTVKVQLAHAFGREPTIQELAKQTGLLPEEIAMAECATASIESIYQPVGEDGFMLENVLSDTETEEYFLEKISLRQGIDKLPEREALVIKLRYYHALTQERVSRILDVSQVQISRIEKKALSHLRTYLEEK